MMERPPCWPEGQQCPNDCAKQLYDRVIYNHTPLWGDWAGFRLAGRELVAPDGQRISVQRLKGILWRDTMELRRAGFTSRRRAERGTGARVKVMVVDLQDYRENGIAAPKNGEPLHRTPLANSRNSLKHGQATLSEGAMSASACVICGTSGAVSAPITSGTYEVKCSLCISFEITGTASATVQQWAKERRWWLAGRVRRHWNETRRAMIVRSDMLDGVTGPQLVGVIEKMDALLFDISIQSAHPGDAIDVSPINAIVADAKPGSELNFLLQSLIDRKLLQAKISLRATHVTAVGWEYLARIRNPATGNRSDIFVAMSFKEALKDAWKSGIEPGIAAAGYRPRRVDSDAHNDKIDDRIIAGIRAAYAVVVDVTTQNAGAYFEAGFAMGLGRPIVWTVRSDDLPNLHFDTRQFNHIPWSDPLELSAKLTDHLLAVFGRGPC